MFQQINAEILLRCDPILFRYLLIPFTINVHLSALVIFSAGIVLPVSAEQAVKVFLCFQQILIIFPVPGKKNCCIRFLIQFMNSLNPSRKCLHLTDIAVRSGRSRFQGRDRRIFCEQFRSVGR